MRSLLIAVPLVVFLAAAAPTQPVDPFDQSGVPVEQLPADPKLKKIVLVAGPPALKVKSGEHEYFAACAVLMKLLKQTPGVFPVVAKDGWPQKPETLPGAAAVVLFVEGGDIHTALKGDRMAELGKLADAGAGVVFLHSAVDFPKDLGDRVRGWAGGAWEKGFSQRAHWVGAFDTFPDHPACRGVKPFKVDDGWLYKHRFAAEMKGVTPLLRTSSEKAPGAPLGPDESVVAWAYDRPAGGRSFVFTGCHLHASWGIDGFRQFVTNGILWSAGVDIPKGGAPVALDPADLKGNLDRKPEKK